jgi:hypothetical protein
MGEPTEGKYTPIGTLGGNSYIVSGLAVVGGKLLVNGTSFYDANYSQPASLMTASPDASVKGEVTGPVKIGTRKVGESSGYIAAIPSAWQTKVGATHCTGNFGLSIISRTSQGPACFATSFASAADGSILATPILIYPNEQPPLGAWDQQSLYHNGTTKPGGLAWPEGTDSLLFFMRHGIGPFCYGAGCNPPLPNSTYAPPYVNQVLAYDANQLLACRTTPGCEPWTLRPYARWEFTFPIDPEERFIGGVAYDKARNRIYLSQHRGEFTAIHVYRVQVPQ